MEKTIDQLKVEAYDYMAAAEHYQMKLRETNQLIAQKAQSLPEPEIKPEVASLPEVSDN